MGRMTTPYNPTRPTYPSPREWVYSLLHQAGTMTKYELAEQTGLSERTIERCLAELRDREKVESARDPTEPRRKVFRPTR